MSLYPGTELFIKCVVLDTGNAVLEELKISVYLKIKQRNWKKFSLNKNNFDKTKLSYTFVSKRLQIIINS